MPQTINQTFPNKVCINLDRRPDRWQRMQDEFARHGIAGVRRFPALDGANLALPENWGHTAGAFGCLSSHLRVIEEARRAGAASVLIFEDDAVLAERFAARFGEFIKQLPADWDMLYFGALHKDEPVRLSENVARVSKADSTYAYALKQTVFDDFIELNRRAAHVLDVNAHQLQQQFNCYCFVPNLAWVQSEYSDVQNRLEHHWYLEQSLVLFGSEIDRLLRQTAVVFAHENVAGNELATANLLFLARYYHEYFAPSIEIVVVEQGPRASSDPGLLPPGSHYLLLDAEEPFDRERCFRAGMSHSAADRRFFILSDDDLYFETLDIRANLRLCATVDAATGFSKTVVLDADQAQRLRASGITRGIDLSKNSGVANTDLTARFCKRDSRPGASIFQSPNHALRLPRA